MLTDTTLRKARPGEKPITLADEKGLFLLIAPTGGKLWRFRYRHAGKQKLLAVGVYPEVSLAQARERRDEARRLLAQGVDPSATKKEAKHEKAAQSENSFEALARDWHRMKSAAWTKSTASKALVHLETYLFPDLGHRPINAIQPRELLLYSRSARSMPPTRLSGFGRWPGKYFASPSDTAGPNATPPAN